MTGNRTSVAIRSIGWSSAGLLAVAGLLGARAFKRPDLFPWTTSAIPVAFCSLLAVAGVVLCLRLHRSGLRRRRAMEEAVRDWRTLGCAALCSTAIAGNGGFAALGIILYVMHRKSWGIR